MFVPTCENCGRCGCECVPLPYTMTVTFSGMVNRTRTQPCEVTFESSFGSGARAVVTDYDSTTDCGTITQVALIDGGECYARLGRVPPDITIGGGSGQGAEFTPTLAETTPYVDGCTVWSIGSVAVSGGTGYTDGESLSVVVNGTVVQQPALTVNVQRFAPTISAAVGGGLCGGGGAVLTVNVTQNVHAGRPTWGVDSVTVESGGDDYTNGASIQFTVQAGAVMALTAIATINTAGGQPDIGDVQFGQPTGSGTGFVGNLEFVLSGGEWYLDVTINDGGSGYAVGDLLWWYSEVNGQSLYSVSAVDENGSVTEMTLIQQDLWPAGQCGPIQSVTVTQRGAYYRLGQGVESVNVNNPGVFYVEDKSLPPCVATITATACNHPATLSVTVDEDTSSSHFGEVIAVNIVDGGGLELDCPPPWDEICTDHWSFNSSESGQRPFVLRAVNPVNLVGVTVGKTCHGHGACIEVGRIPDQAECPPGGPEMTMLWDGQPTSLNYVIVRNGGSEYAKRGRVTPVLTTAAQPSAVSFSFSFVQESDDCGLPYWKIDTIDVTINDGGSYYTEGQALSLSGATPSDIIGRAGTAIVHTLHTAPTITASVAGGNGANIYVTIEEVSGGWAVSSVTLVSGGSGYPGRSNITFNVAANDVTLAFAGGTALANQSGQIVAVVLEYGGLYYHDTGTPNSVTVQDGGEYWREDNTLPPYVLTPTATVVQLPPGTGSGAQVTLTVGQDPTNGATFGKVINATLVSGGSGYSLFGGPSGYTLFGEVGCQYVGGCGDCGVNYGEDPYAMLTFRGLGEAPLLEVPDPRYNSWYIFRASTPLADCANPPTEYTLISGAPSGTATVEPGGLWDSRGTDCYNRGGGGGGGVWFGGCECPADLIGTGACVSISSTLPCDGGSASYTGPWGDAALNCEYTDPETETVYENDLLFEVECCDQSCSDEGPCVYQVRVLVSGIFFNAVTGQPQSLASTPGECVALNVSQESGITGTASVPMGDYSATITFGCN